MYFLPPLWTTSTSNLPSWNITEGSGKVMGPGWRRAGAILGSILSMSGDMLISVWAHTTNSSFPQENACIYSIRTVPWAPRPGSQDKAVDNKDTAPVLPGTHISTQHGWDIQDSLLLFYRSLRHRLSRSIPSYLIRKCIYSLVPSEIQ